MTSEEQEAFLREPNIAVLCTVDRRGRPHGHPVWYMYEDGDFIINTGRGSQKHKNVEANAETTLVIDRRSAPYYVLMVHGPAAIEPSLADTDRRRLAGRYLPPEQVELYMRTVGQFPSITLRLRPHKVIEFRPPL